MKDLIPIAAAAVPFVVLVWVPAVLIVFLAAAWMASRRRERMLEMIHQERKLAIEKGVPGPELPTLPVHGWHQQPFDPRRMLASGIVVTFVGNGTVAALILVGSPGWPFGLIPSFMGVGMLLAYWLTRDKR
jgi:hypothetical protein